MPSLSVEFWVGTAVAVLLSILAFAVSIGMDARTKGEYAFVVVCFCISWLVLVSMIGLWTISSGTALSRRLLAALTIALMSWAFLEAIRWAQARHERAAEARQPEMKAESQASAAKFIFWYVQLLEQMSIVEEGKKLGFRFTFKNDGPIEAREVRIISVQSLSQIPPPGIEQNIVAAFRATADSQRSQAHITGPTIPPGQITQVDVATDFLTAAQAASLLGWDRKIV